MMIHKILVSCLCLLITVPSIAASTATTPHFTAELVAESLTPAAGKNLTVAIVIEPQAGWHTYWSNPGEIGLPPDPHWTLPAGVTAGTLQHPVPTQMVVEDIISHVHEGTTILLSDFALDSTLASATRLPIGLKLDVLICSESLCIPENVTVDLVLVTGDGAADSAVASLFAQARSQLPKTFTPELTYTITDTDLQLQLPELLPANIVVAQFFPDTDGQVVRGKQTLRTKSGQRVLTIPRNGLPTDAPLSGLLRLEIAGTEPAVKGFHIIAHAGSLVPAAIPEPVDVSFWLALAGAILGGLLLNLMPCVFPILSLKALTLVKAGGHEAETRIEAIGYTMGAITVLVMLGAIVLLLKQAGHAAGWAFQLQDPRVVAVLALLVIAIATNLAGLYELPSFSFAVGQRKGLWGGIGSGALAAFVATPCTGPFMAGALGTALLLPAPAALAVFAGLGFGLALPFLGLAYYAPLRRWLPRPGNWMQTFRRLLSLPMFATAVWLYWIVGREAGVVAMTESVTATLILGLALWWYGLRQNVGQSATPVLFPMIASVLLALGIANTQSVATESGNRLLNNQPYSAALLAEIRARHQPVFLYLTADWCMICKVNEATSLSSADVAQAFSKAGVAVLEGDWTRGNPEISQLLQSQGRAGVPLYLWYSGDKPPVELPQVLSPSMLVALTDSVDSVSVLSQ